MPILLWINFCAYLFGVSVVCGVVWFNKTHKYVH